MGGDFENVVGNLDKRPPPENPWFLIVFTWPRDDVIKWKHFPRYWLFVRGIHRFPVNSQYKSQWRGALMFSLICVWINGWVNNREAGDLRRFCVHYVTVMLSPRIQITFQRRKHALIASELLGIIFARLTNVRHCTILRKIRCRLSDILEDMRDIKAVGHISHSRFHRHLYLDYTGVSWK